MIRCKVIEPRTNVRYTGGDMVDPRLPKLRERRQFLGIDIYQGKARMQANTPTQTEYALIEDCQAEYNELDLVLSSADRLSAVDLTLPDAVRILERRMSVQWFGTWQLLLVAAATLLFLSMATVEVWQWISGWLMLAR